MKKQIFPCLIILVSLLALPALVSAAGDSRDKSQKREVLAARVFPNPAVNHVIFDLQIEDAGLTEIIVRDMQGRCLYHQAEYYPAPGFYRQTWSPVNPGGGMVLFEIIHDGSRRLTGQVVITPP